MKFQIGKNGINSGIIESLSLAFKMHKVVRISVLKGAFRERGKIKEFASELADKLEGNYRYKIIGFTIVMKKAGSGIKKVRK